MAGDRMGALRFDWHLDEFQRIRTSPGLRTWLTDLGTQLVSELNAELHAAQQKRNQPVEDGYKFYVVKGGESRYRLHVLAFTARGMAHEAKHQSILRKLGEAAAIVERSEATADRRDRLAALRRAERNARRGNGGRR